jgi:hypothetical protein
MRWIFSIYLILPRRIMALGLTQPLTEMSTRNIPGSKGRPAHRAENLTAICEHCLETVEASMSHNLMASTTCYRDSFTFLHSI